MGKKKLSNDEFIQRARNIHGNKYTYNEQYYSMGTSLNIVCPTHGTFKQVPSEHIKGYGCFKCATKRRTKTLAQFKIEANLVHNNIYRYGKYENCHTKMSIKCSNHGWFKQTPNKHLRGHGCPSCARKMFSNIAIDWLNSISLNIQHAKNGGEYWLPEIRTHVDGFCANTNTVYEFHGDKFHGNPKVYKKIEYCHPFNPDITAQELYDQTIIRENKIKDAGYNLIVKWEHDYLAGD